MYWGGQVGTLLHQCDCHEWSCDHHHVVVMWHWQHTNKAQKSHMPRSRDRTREQWTQHTNTTKSRSCRKRVHSMKKQKGLLCQQYTLMSHHFMRGKSPLCTCHKKEKSCPGSRAYSVKHHMLVRSSLNSKPSHVWSVKWDRLFEATVCCCCCVVHLYMYSHHSTAMEWCPVQPLNISRDMDVVKKRE